MNGTHLGILRQHAGHLMDGLETGGWHKAWGSLIGFPEQ